MVSTADHTTSQTVEFQRLLGRMTCGSCDLTLALGIFHSIRYIMTELGLEARELRLRTGVRRLNLRL
jgi:hypothetical protein